VKRDITRTTDRRSNKMKKKLDLQLDIAAVKAYEPQGLEPKIYSYWEENGLLKPKANEQEDKKKRFTTILPPPNANGNLHLGHASGYSYQDLMGRYHRMLGEEVLLLPGKDHAGIQTEVVFEKELEKKGIKKRELGREEFYKRCYEFCMEMSANARGQERRLGTSADYTKEIFTLDPRIKKVVFDTFVKMYSEGLIYRGKRIINWCVKDQTALADIDTEPKEEDGKLYYIKFGPFTIATTRPETKLADTAIAVNPKDKRYKKYIGQEVEVVSPEGTYNLPVIEDYDVDMTFGTGVLKVTPGHSMEDFKIGQRHNLPVKTVIDFHGRMAANAGKYAGMKVMEAREAIVKDLDEMGLLVKTEDIKHNVKVCERCKNMIEPLISYQWFVQTDDLKKQAIESIGKKEITFHPQRQEKNLMHWLETPEDWCISRQLWWGYQIPTYYCGGKQQSLDSDGNVVETYGGDEGCGYIIASAEEPTECPKCGGKNLVHDEDVLDTWYSSGQWPYATLLAWDDFFDRYFPTQALDTARDILTQWVARMMMLSLYNYQVEPFQHVHLHGIVLDKDGKKQSKSKNNGVDPMIMINKYGADALRLSFIVGNGPDQDYRLFDEKVKGFRNFINKLWNATRFSILQFNTVKDAKKVITLATELQDKKKREAFAKECPESQEAFELHIQHIAEMKKSIEAYNFGQAGDNAFIYFWHRFCDIDIENIKKLVAEHPENQEAYIGLLFYLLIDEIKAMHPFIPFVTEYLWQILGSKGFHQDESESIMYASYPTVS
jgi:valyl-tRNA synthetase